MRPSPTLLLLVALAGCAGPSSDYDAPTRWRLAGYAPGTAPAGPVQQAALKRDDAACRYEIQMARVGAVRPAIGSTGPYADQLDAIGEAMLAGPGPGAYDLCMRARGWEQARYPAWLM